LVPVTALRRSVGSRREERRTGRLGGLRVADSVVPADAEVEAVATLDSVRGGIEVLAEIRAGWSGECRRCLRPVGGELLCEVREMFRPREAGEEDEETYPLVGDQLDLQPLVRDALLLELPLAPLCRPDCPGLCPICGTDLSEGPCGCQASDRDERWAALDALAAERDEPGRPGSGRPGSGRPGSGRPGSGHARSEPLA
jgi:uncharacterized protein